MKLSIATIGSYATFFFIGCIGIYAGRDGQNLPVLLGGIGIVSIILSSLISELFGIKMFGES